MGRNKQRKLPKAKARVAKESSAKAAADVFVAGSKREKNPKPKTVPENY